MNILRKIQNELDEQKTTIVQQAEKVTEQVTQNINNLLVEKFQAMEEKYENLKETLENQEKRLYFLEKQSRQRNVVIFGLEETERSYADLEKIVMNFIHKYFPLKLQRSDVQEARRIGKKGDKPRPITVTLSTLGIKIDILKQRQKLKDTTYYIKEDFPHYILEKRKELQEQLKIEKEKGNHATIRYDKLIVRPKTTVLSTNKKRSMPISPEYKAPTQKEEQRAQASKKNKTQTGLQRTSSFSEGVIKPGMLNFLTTKNSK